MSMTTRLFLVTALLIALAAAAVAGIGRWQGDIIAERTALGSLQSSEAVQEYFQERRSRELELISELLASDRPFVAYIAQALAASESGGGVDVASILDLVGERRTQLGFDVAVVLTPQGRVVADTRTPIGTPRDLSQVPAVAEALRRLAPARGAWIDGDRAYQIALVPLLLGSTLEGMLLTGLEIDDELARDIGRVSGTEVLFAHGAGAKRRLLASSLDLAEAQGLMQGLAAHDEMLRASTRPGALDLTLLAASGEWKARVTPLADDLEGDALRIAMVRPERRAAVMDDIGRLMLWGAVAAALVILLMPLAISLMVLQPIARLADGADRAGRGDLPQPIRVSGGGDVQRLGRSINRVLADLREQKDIESYLSEVWHRRASVPAPLPPEATDDQRLAPGQLLGGRYEIRELIDRGGMGVVYRATDHELAEDVALKTLRLDGGVDAGRIDQLKTEIRTARRITHANVVRTFDFGHIDGLPFISMEFVRGITLREALLRSGRVRLHAGLRIARQVCAGLNAAHRAGVLHRDIKPSNVMLDMTGNAKLMDFGIASSGTPMAAKGDTAHTFAGSPKYLSPEQCQGRDVRETSDIYSLGVLFAEMFTGNVPIDGNDTLDICLGHLEREPVRPSVSWPEIPPLLEALILRCLEKDPARRYPNTDALRDDLERLRF